MRQPVMAATKPVFSDWQDITPILRGKRRGQYRTVLTHINGAVWPYDDVSFNTASIKDFDSIIRAVVAWLCKHELGQMKSRCRPLGHSTICKMYGEIVQSLELYLQKTTCSSKDVEPEVASWLADTRLPG